jgi:hypothetical protein
LWEERRLRLFENRVLRRIFGPKRDQVTGEWTKLHNEELYNLYSSTTIVRLIKSRMRWAGHVAHMGEGRGVYRVLVGKPEKIDHWGHTGGDARTLKAGSSGSGLWGYGLDSTGSG